MIEYSHILRSGGFIVNQRVRNILLYVTCGGIAFGGSVALPSSKAEEMSYVSLGDIDSSYEDNLGEYQLMTNDGISYKESTGKSQTIYLDDPSQEIIIENDVPSDFYCFTSKDFYEELISAKEGFKNLFDKGSVSTQMKKNGCDLSSNEAKFIDQSLNEVYSNISKYIKCFKNEDYMNCYRYGVLLYNSYYQNFGYNELYQLLVEKNLPKKYQSNISYQDSTNDAYVLENGKQIRLIGSSQDELLSSNKYSSDLYEDALLKMKWYKKLPSMIMNRYSAIEDNYLDSDSCYLLNEKYAEDLCNNEWNKIIEEESKTYGFSKKNVSVYWDYDCESYIYVDSNNNILGIASSNNGQKIDQILMVEDAIETHEGNVYELDYAIRGMSHDNNKSKSK